jgi:hypothetical protein
MSTSTKRTVHITQEPVVLEGYQAITRPSKYGYSLSALFDTTIIERLDAERAELLKWCESKLKNPKRSTLKPEPWEEVKEGVYKLKFSWDEETKPPIVDSEGTPVTEDLPLFGGSKVKVAFRQKPYVLKDGVTYGTSVKIVGIQVISVNGSAGFDAGDYDETEVAALFGQTAGFKAGDPNVTPNESSESEEDDEF